MGDEQKRDVALHDLLHLFGALIAKRAVADGQRLIDDEDFRVDVDADGKAEARFHTAGVRAHRLVNVFFELRKINDGRLELCDVFIVKAQNAALEVNVFAAGKFLVKAACELQKRADDAVDVNFAACGERDAGDHFKHGGFARAVAS